MTTPVTTRKQTMLLPEEEFAWVAEGFRELIDTGSRIEPGLRAVVRDSVEHAGSLLRAQLAFGIMRDLGAAPDSARRIAIAIEYFHTASLIFDDMPFMDNATERRGHPCPHAVYGEASATLGALALITQAYSLLWETLALLPEPRRVDASRLVSSCLGIGGILDGQARDLAFARETRTADDVLRVADGKTVSLIRLTLLLPAMAGGAPDATMGRLERIATAWGRAYQIIDDFKDCMMSGEETGKSTARDSPLGRPNYPTYAGMDGALSTLAALLDDARAIADLLAASHDAWVGLIGLQAILDGEHREIERRLAIGKCA